MNPLFEILAERYPDLRPCLPDVQAAYALLENAYVGGGKVLVCGNGGSASDSDHIVGELMKGFMQKRPIPAAFREKLSSLFPDEGDRIGARLQGALPAISLPAHSALATAFANDVDPELVFAQQVYGYGRPGDVLIGLSTSGNSANVLQALRVARALGLRTLGLTGKDGGKMKALCDTTIRVPYTSTPEIQERHLPIYHALCIAVEKRFFDPAQTP